MTSKIFLKLLLSSLSLLVIIGCGNRDVQVDAGPELTKNTLARELAEKKTADQQNFLTVLNASDQKSGPLKLSVQNLPAADFRFAPANQKVIDPQSKVILIDGDLFDETKYSELIGGRTYEDKEKVRNLTSEEIPTRGPSFSLAFVNIWPFKVSAAGISPNPYADRNGHLLHRLIPILIRVNTFRIAKGTTLKTEGRPLRIFANNIQIDGQIDTSAPRYANYPGLPAGDIEMNGVQANFGPDCVLIANGADGGEVHAEAADRAISVDEQAAVMKKILDSSQYTPLASPVLRRPDIGMINAHWNPEEMTLGVSRDDSYAIVDAVNAAQSTLSPDIESLIESSIGAPSRYVREAKSEVGLRDQMAAAVRYQSMDLYRGKSRDDYQHTPPLEEAIVSTLMTGHFETREMRIAPPAGVNFVEEDANPAMDHFEVAMSNRLVKGLPGGSGGHIRILRAIGKGVCAAQNAKGKDSAAEASGGPAIRAPIQNLVEVTTRKTEIKAILELHGRDPATPPIPVTGDWETATSPSDPRKNLRKLEVKIVSSDNQTPVTVENPAATMFESHPSEGTFDARTSSENADAEKLLINEFQKVENTGTDVDANKSFAAQVQQATDLFSK